MITAIVLAFVACNAALGVTGIVSFESNRAVERRYVVSKTLEYGWLCLQELESREGENLEVREIAEKHGIPTAYCQKVLRNLARAGLVYSEKGSGFMMLKSKSQVTPEQLRRALLK